MRSSLTFLITHFLRSLHETLTHVVPGMRPNAPKRNMLIVIVLVLLLFVTVSMIASVLGVGI